MVATGPGLSITDAPRGQRHSVSRSRPVAGKARLSKARKGRGPAPWRARSGRLVTRLPPHPLCSHPLGGSQIQRSRVNALKLRGWSVTAAQAKLRGAGGVVSRRDPGRDPGNDTTHQKGPGLLWSVRWPRLRTQVPWQRPQEAAAGSLSLNRRDPGDGATSPKAEEEPGSFLTGGPGPRGDLSRPALSPPIPRNRRLGFASGNPRVEGGQRAAGSWGLHNGSAPLDISGHSSHCVRLCHSAF